MPTPLYPVLFTSFTPSGELLLHDHADVEKHLSLERYCDDLYHLFLAEITQLPEQAVLEQAQRQKLERLFNELLDVKEQLADGLQSQPPGNGRTNQ